MATIVLLIEIRETQRQLQYSHHHHPEPTRPEGRYELGGEIMDEVTAILERLDHGDNIGEIRNDIAHLISQCLQQNQETLDYWEKLYCANAIAAFHLNNVPGAEPTPLWLRLSLYELERAFVPANERDEGYLPKHERISQLTFEQLARMLDMAG
jgi:hypothetical protein